MTKQNSGYDMKDTLRWYASQIAGLSLGNIGMRKNWTIENPQLAQLEPEYVHNVISLFSRNARERSILDKISWQKPLWFAKATLGTGIPTPTGVSSDAISPTAIIPGYTAYRSSRKGNLRASIELYRMETWIPELIQGVIHTQALAHEFAHTILAPALYGEQKLKLPNGEIVDGHDFVMDLGRKAEAHIPISHYASAYRDFHPDCECYDKEATKSRVLCAGGSRVMPFKYIDDGIKTAVSEELAETIAQMVLPFALHNDYGLSKDKNLGNRPDVVSGLEAFLNAGKVAKN